MADQVRGMLGKYNNIVITGIFLVALGTYVLPVNFVFALHSANGNTAVGANQAARAALKTGNTGSGDTGNKNRGSNDIGNENSAIGGGSNNQNIGNENSAIGGGSNNQNIGNENSAIGGGGGGGSSQIIGNENSGGTIPGGGGGGGGSQIGNNCAHSQCVDNGHIVIFFS